MTEYRKVPHFVKPLSAMLSIVRDLVIKDRARFVHCSLIDSSVDGPSVIAEIMKCGKGGQWGLSVDASRKKPVA